MKTLFALLACAGLLVVCAGTANAQAQAIQANIPFAFTAANQSLPAGEYRFSVDADQRVVRIAEEHGNRIWLVRMVGGGETRAAADTDKGLLQFTRRGHRHDLNGIWLSGSTLGRAVMPSKVPRELAATPALRESLRTR